MAFNYLFYQKGVIDPAQAFELATEDEITTELFEVLPLENLNPRDFIKFIPNHLQM